MEYIITFKNTHFAIKAEQKLLAKNLQVGVLPLPTQISAGCGICLKIQQGDLETALEELSSIPEIEIFSKTGGHYEKINNYNQ